MSRIILITGEFDIYDERGTKSGSEFVISHGIDEDTGKTVILPAVHPKQLWAKFDPDLLEWVLEK